VSTVWLCPGQGAQRVGMGKDLAERFPDARSAFQEIDDALGYSLSRIMFEGPESELTRTDNAQPAILTHTVAIWKVLGGAGSRKPGAVAAAGHSLGETSAYVTAGAIDAPAAAKLVRRRGELMNQAGQERPGTMAAVLGLASADVEAICRAASTGNEVVVAANLNAPDQTVISGDPAAVDRAGAECKAKGAKRVLPLKVSGAFHSPLMALAAERYRAVIAEAGFRDPAFPVIANATAQPVEDAAAARKTLADQLTAPVRWVDSMRRAADLAGASAQFIEIGPGAVLAGLLKRIVSGANVVSLGSADEVSKFLEAA
jgi:[acyl-carrier-protein] S-malonyltransferase